MEHEEFLLFPSLFHQQRDFVTASAQQRYDEIAPGLPSPTSVRIEFFARVAEWWKLESLSDARSLQGGHIWTDQVIAERFEWGGEQAIFAIAVRVYRLAAPFVGAMLPQYGGCKSWINLDREVEINRGRLTINFRRGFRIPKLEKTARLPAVPRGCRFARKNIMPSPRLILALQHRRGAKNCSPRLVSRIYSYAFGRH